MCQLDPSQIDPEQKELRMAFARMKRQLVQQQWQLDEHEEMLTAKQRAIAHFLKDKPHAVKIYYQTMVTSLSSAFLALFVRLNSKGILAAPPGGLSFLAAMEKSSTKEQVASIMLYLGIGLEQMGLVEEIRKALAAFMEIPTLITKITSSDYFKLVPIVGTFVKIMTDLALEEMDKKKLENVRRAFCGLTASQLEDFAERTTRQLTETYDTSISQLTDQSAVECAHFGANRVVIALLLGVINDPEQFTRQASQAVRTLDIKQDQTQILGYKIPFTRTPLVHHDPNITLTENDFYHQRGAVA